MSDSETYLPRPYCTQPRKIGETCWGCSLVNYGQDCMNNPVAPPSHIDGLSTTELARLAAVGLAQDAQARLLREMDYHDCGGQWRKPIRYPAGVPLADFEADMNRYGGRYGGPVTPAGTRSILRRLLETAEYLQAEEAEEERGAWIARAREALGRPAAT